MSPEANPPTSPPPLHRIGSAYLGPRFDLASVRDVMRPGVISCPPDTPLSEVGRIMATYRIHAVVVGDPDGHHDGRPWGVISDLDMALAAAAGAFDRRAGSLSRPGPVTVAPDDSVRHAAELMGDRDLSHLLVVDPGHNRPLGVISTLDIAGSVAWAPSD